MRDKERRDLLDLGDAPALGGAGNLWLAQDLREWLLTLVRTDA